MSDILIDQPISIAFAALAPEVLQSCVLLAPAAPPPPPANDVIYTPVAPGIIYESLPTVIIVDTSPDQIIGCIHDTASNPQARLNALFSSAIDGDGVIERRNDDIWVYDGALWNNVGPTPGPTIQMVQPLILPYNETAIYNGILRTRLGITKFDYSLTLLTVIDPLTITLGVSVARVIPSTNISLAAHAPTLLRDVGLQVPAGAINITAHKPYVQKLRLSIPVSTLQLFGHEPDVQASLSFPNLRVTIPPVDFALTPYTPTLLITVNVSAIAYTQSSTWSGTTAASNAIMTDQSFTNTGAATGFDSPAWIRMDLGGSTRVGSIIVGTATSNIPGGWDRSYTEDKNLEYSQDDTTWTTATNTGTFTSDGIYTFNVDFTARYIRIASTSSDYVAVSEFYALAPGQVYP